MRAAGRTIGSVVRQWRLTRGMSLEALAARVGCAKSYLSEIENGRRIGPPGNAILRGIEVALGLPAGALQDLAAWERTPRQVKKRVEELEHRERAVQRLVELVSCVPAGSESVARSLGRSLDAAFRAGELDGLLHPAGAGGRGSRVDALLPREIPVIEAMGSDTAGVARWLGGCMGSGGSSRYVRSPDIDDPDAFAARVVDDAMAPEYQEGDIVIFSPRRHVSAGMDCLVRLGTGEAILRRVYFEGARPWSAGGDPGLADGRVRLEALNRKSARMEARGEIAGMYAAISVTRAVGRPDPQQSAR